MFSKSITFFAILFSASLCLGEGFLKVGYNSKTDEIWIQTKNNCIELDVIYTGECTKSVPGRTTLYVVETGRPIVHCNKSIFQKSYFAVSRLNCRPALVTVQDQSGLWTEFLVPQ
jgi:hypothetical protein